MCYCWDVALRRKPPSILRCCWVFLTHTLLMPYRRVQTCVLFSTSRSHGGDFTAQGTCGNVRRHFRLSQVLGEGGRRHLVRGGHRCCKHPTVRRTAPAKGNVRPQISVLSLKNSVYAKITSHSTLPLSFHLSKLSSLITWKIPLNNQLKYIGMLITIHPSTPESCIAQVFNSGNMPVFYEIQNYLNLVNVSTRKWYIIKV